MLPELYTDIIAGLDNITKTVLYIPNTLIDISIIPILYKIPHVNVSGATAIAAIPDMDESFEYVRDNSMIYNLFIHMVKFDKYVFAEDPMIFLPQKIPTTVVCESPDSKELFFIKTHAEFDSWNIKIKRLFFINSELTLNASGIIEWGGPANVIAL